MKTDNKLGTFKEIVQSYSSEVNEIAKNLRVIIEKIHPDAYEVPRKGERAISYGIGPSKMKQAYCYIMPQKEYVNLGFFRGTHLNDPSKLLEGNGNKLRHIKIRSLEQSKSAEILSIIKQALDELKSSADK